MDAALMLSSKSTKNLMCACVCVVSLLGTSSYGKSFGREGEYSSTSELGYVLSRDIWAA